MTKTGSGSLLPPALDLASVLKASQAISGQLVLSELLTALMQSVIENAGAQVAYLILPLNREEANQRRPEPVEGWQIVASQRAEGEVVLHVTPVESSQQLSVECWHGALRDTHQRAACAG